MGIRFERSNENYDEAFNLKALLNPADAFAHPTDVVHDPDLTINEKRAILASWASDACAVASAPALRALSLASKPVTFDEVMDALRELDKQARASPKPVPHYRRVLAGSHRFVSEQRTRQRARG